MGWGAGMARLRRPGLRARSGSPRTFPAVIPAKAGSALLRRSRTSRAFRAILPIRHSRESGNPEPSAPSFQSVIPAKAGIQGLSCENA
ncbi:hypothetical protein LG3211_2316 [Lysobacter gummosus]|nr:hypothetical protein LG3211_2316 [Lysobacter gummosus]